MQTGKRNIIDGEKFKRFFTKPIGKFITVKKKARLGDTIHWMRRVISGTLNQTKELANFLRGKSVRESCNNIWKFCFHYFQYERDRLGTEELRTPRRSFADRKTGIDCDCFSILIGTMLKNLKIPYVLRMTRYKEPDFEHIYPVALTPQGEIIIDAVVHQFDFEVPYTAKKDVNMDLQILNGVPEERFNEFGDKVHFENDLPIDAEDLFLDEMELQGLEGKAEREARKRKRKNRRTERKKLPLKERVKEGLKRGVHAINRVNPGAALLRAGMLASMKLNLFKVASHLRFAYWTNAQAAKNGMDMRKFNQLQRIREKMEKIYFGAGGKPDKLKKAILTGKGNRNKMVKLVSFRGLGSIPNDEDDLSTILGQELMEDIQSGLAGLGEPITTGAAIAASSGVMGTLAGLIKKLGGLFKKGSAAANKFKSQDLADDMDEKQRKFSVKNVFRKVKQKIQDRKARKAAEETGEFTDEFETDEFSPNTDTELAPIEPSPEDEFILDEDFTPPSRQPEIDPNQPDNDQSDTTETTQDDAGDDENSEADKEKGFLPWLKRNWIGVSIGTAGLGVGGWLLVKQIKKARDLAAMVGTGGKKTKSNPKSLNGAPKKKSTAKKKTSSTTTKKRTTKAKTTRKKRSNPPKKIELL